MYDVIAIGEILVEVSTAEPFGHGVPGRLGISGDALNVAAAAAAAGARTAIVAIVPDDELGDSVVGRVRALNISDEMIVRRDGQQGVYFVHADPSGQREFSYARTGSVGSTLCVDDLPLHHLAEAGVVVASGITAAISTSGREALLAAARMSRRFAYDPNFRPRLMSAEDAAALLDEVVSHAWVVTPSHPAETAALLHVSSAEDAVASVAARGPAVVAVTKGADGVTLGVNGTIGDVAAVPASRVVDQTGAGDSFLGTLVARLALGDDPRQAARLAVSAASLAVGFAGGADTVASLDAVRTHAQAAA